MKNKIPMRLKKEPLIEAVWEARFTPRTELGEKLLAIRNKAIAKGMKLLTEDEVLEEVKRRRGEIEDKEVRVISLHSV